MTGSFDHGGISAASESYAKNIKKRIRLLILVSTVAVALVFGLTFYFALVSNESALASQVPELGAVAAKLKSILLVNTLVVVAIIIASFFALSSLITERMFSSLGSLHKDMIAFAEGKLPRSRESRDSEPFSALDGAFTAVVSFVLQRERAEIEELTRCAEAISRISASLETARKLDAMIKSKKAFLSTGDSAAPEKAKEAKEAEQEALFIQPL